MLSFLLFNGKTFEGMFKKETTLEEKTKQTKLSQPSLHQNYYYCLFIYICHQKIMIPGKSKYFLVLFLIECVQNSNIYKWCFLYHFI